MMTNQELYNQMQEELPHYQIGFHQISLQKHQEVVRCNNVRALDFRIDGENVDEKVIANRILQRGFQIWDTRMGLCSTAYFPKNFSADKLNYKYYHRDQQVCNILFAIPYSFIYERNEYFIGNLCSPLDAGSKIIFNDSIPPEFVYGYYEKQTPVVYTPIREFHFSDELNFFKNDNFFAYLETEKQKQVVKQIFEEKRKGRVLRLVNNHSQLGLLNFDSLTRFIIRTTRKQKKIYVKSLPH